MRKSDLSNVTYYNISAYKVAANGVITLHGVLLIDNPLPTYAGTDKLAVHPQGKFIYAVNRYADELSIARIDESGLHKVTPASQSGSRHSIAMDAQGRFLYTLGDNSIKTFIINQDTGELTASGAPTAISGTPKFIAVEPNGEYAYIVHKGNYPGNGLVSTYRINADGSLQYITGSDQTLGQVASSITIDPSGRYAYATSDNSNELHVFSIDVTTGLLTFNRKIRTRLGPQMVELGLGTKPVTTTLKHLYAIHFSLFHNVTPLTVNGDGTVSLLARPDGVKDHSLGAAITPDRRFLYVANNYDKSISYYSIDANGLLNLVNRVTTGAPPWSMLVDPSGRYLFVVQNDSSPSSTIYSLRVFSIQPDTGSLQQVGLDYTLGLDPQRIVIHPSGRHIYVANYSGNSISAFNLQTDGTLTTIGIGTYGSGNKPRDLTIDPSGMYLYTANSGDFTTTSNLSAYRIEPHGELTTLTAITSGIDPTAITISPEGRFAYVALSGAAGQEKGQILRYTVNNNTGQLENMTTVSSESGAYPKVIGVDPSGTFLYVGSGSLAGYKLQPDGSLKAVTGSPFYMGYTNSVDHLVFKSAIE